MNLKVNLLFYFLLFLENIFCNLKFRSLMIVKLAPTWRDTQSGVLPINHQNQKRSNILVL